jgi:putative DNA primase/helicase
MLILLHRTSAAWCEFSLRPTIVSACDAIHVGPFPRPWTDADDVTFSMFLATEYQLTISPDSLAPIVKGLAHQRAYHPVRSYLDALQWDGQPRLQDWLTRAFGEEATNYTSEVGKRFLISAVARVMEPGCQADSMLVVRGPQGIGKTRSIELLFGKSWFSSQLADLGTKDASSNLCGVWCVEWAELDNLQGQTAQKVRAYVSRASEHYRRSFGKYEVDQPRQCVFVGTTNEQVFLSDPAGARRFWVITATKGDRAWISANRDQLWAEAYDAYTRGEQWHITDANVLQHAASVADDAYDADVWSDLVLRYASAHEGGGFTTLEVATQCLSIEPGRVSRYDQIRIGTILRKAGWKTSRGTDGSRRYSLSPPMPRQ